jgi:HSP20 family protein
MTLVRWNPRNDSLLLDPLFRGVQELFNDRFFDGGSSWYPAMDLVEEKDHFIVKLEMPGIDPKNVQLNLQGDLLTVTGERKEEHDSKEEKVLKRERTYGSFQRSVQLPYRVQADRVKATYTNGIMTITLPKAEEYVGRQIPVEVK